MASSRPVRAGAGLLGSIFGPACTSRSHTARTAVRQYQCRRHLSQTPRAWQQAAAATATSTPPKTASRPAPQPPAPHSSSASNLPADHALTPSPLHSLTDGLIDPPPFLDEHEKQVDWTRSYHGLSSTPFSPEQGQLLMAAVDTNDIEIKPDGILYLPEIKYRRILNRVFGPGGWGLAPRGETIVTGKLVTREYGLVCGGRLVSIARGEQQYFDPDGIPTATEGCKSNALMRCCKDLGIASELWDPRYIKGFVRDHAKEMIVEHAVTKKRRKHWMRRDDELKYPLKEVSGAQAGQVRKV
nr:hypothetical protein B0A51_04212 [Rachicladosporium sp. CCFEE 5018]